MYIYRRGQLGIYRKKTKVMRADRKVKGKEEEDEYNNISGRRRRRWRWWWW